MPRVLASVLAGLAVLAAARAEEKGAVTEIDGLKSTAPAAWKAKEVTAPNRVYHFALPKEKGDKHDAEVIVFFFGAGSGGTRDANVERWKKQITPPEGKKADDVCKVEDVKIGDVKATIVDAAGTYTHKTRPFDPNDKGEQRENYRLLNVFFDSPKGPYFIRLVGPAKTVEAHKKGFDEWLKNFK